MFDDEISKITSSPELATYICSEISWASERIREYRYKIKYIEDGLLSLSRFITRKGFEDKTSLEELKSQNKDVEYILDIIHDLCNSLDDTCQFKAFNSEIKKILK